MVIHNINSAIVLKTFSILLLLSFSTNISAQWIKGTTIDKENKPIPFVSIGVFKGNYGSVSDARGNFSLDRRRIRSTDSIRFSSIGYKTKDFLVSNLKDSETIITLEEKIYQISDVVIKLGETMEIRFLFRE